MISTVEGALIEVSTVALLEGLGYDKAQEQNGRGHALVLLYGKQGHGSI